MDRWGVSTSLARLELAQMAFVLRAQEDASLPAFLGSTIRGGLARAFRSLTCALRNQSCNGCILKERCQYSILFETPPDSSLDAWQRRQSWPRPIVIQPPGHEPPRSWKAGDQLRFSVTLFGRAIDSFPFLLVAVRNMGRRGLGKNRHPFALDSAVDLLADEASLYVATSDENRLGTPRRMTASDLTDMESCGGNSMQRMHLRFCTPLRLRRHGKEVSDLTPELLVDALLGRLQSLVEFHCGGGAPLLRTALLDMARNIGIDSNGLTIRRLSRWSNRQRQEVPLDGLCGELVLSGKELVDLAPLILAGEVMRVGKGTVFGLGHYEVERGTR